MDAIQIDLTVPSREDHSEQAAETNDHSDHMIHQSPINNPGDDDNIGEVGMSRHNVSSSRSTEYKVTKKLAIVSTLNILLNLPWYFLLRFSLKLFKMINFLLFYYNRNHQLFDEFEN